MKFTTELSLSGTACWTPETVEYTADAVAAGKITQQAADELGVASVPAAPADLHPPAMAVLAARTALARAQIDARAIDMVMHCCIWHQGHDMWSAAHFIANELDTGRTLPLTVSQGCNAVVTALELGAARLLADQDVEAVLVTAADRFILPGFDRWTGQYACAHGDAATATVLHRGAPRGSGLLLRSISSVAVPELEEMNRAGLEPTPAPRWNSENLDLRVTKKSFIEKYGFDRFEKLGREAVHTALREALAEAEVEPDDPRVRCVTMPRMSTKSITASYFPIIAEITPAAPLALNARTGHLACSDALANIADMGETHLLRPGDVGIVLNTGGGYTWSATVLEVPGA